MEKKTNESRVHFRDSERLAKTKWIRPGHIVFRLAGAEGNWALECAEGRVRVTESIRMAHVSGTRTRLSSTRGNRIQSDAGAVAPFFVTIHVDVYTQAISPAKHAAQAAVVVRV
jgi:hypothetical protein